MPRKKTTDEIPVDNADLQDTTPELYTEQDTEQSYDTDTEQITMQNTEPEPAPDTEKEANSDAEITDESDIYSLSDANAQTGAESGTDPGDIKGAETTVENAEATSDPQPAEHTPTPKPAPKLRKKTFFDLKLNELDRDLSDEQRTEWNAIYASYRAKSALSGVAIGADQNSFEIVNRETGQKEQKSLFTLIVINYRVKIIIPETELWMPGEERPSHTVRGMVGAKLEYVIMEIDRENECAIASRRLALAAKRHYFARGEHHEGEPLKCNIIAVGAKQLSAECNGFDLHLTQRDLSYTAIADLRENYRPGQELPCRLKEYDAKTGKLAISVKEVNPNPFIGADRRHPVGSRRQATISGKYGGGVFCNLPDGAVCLCLYSAQHTDADFRVGNGVILVITQYDYRRELIFGRILSKW